MGRLKAAHTERAWSDNTENATDDAPRSVGNVPEAVSPKKPTSGGSSEIEQKVPTTIPTGPSSVIVAATATLVGN
ncbi:hypothetical protein GCM10027298_33510 [Epidermidibacterium keratini]